jgi:hypothetical protein
MYYFSIYIIGWLMRVHLHEHQLMRSERGTGAHAPEESLHGHANLLPYVGKVTEVNPKLANPHTI